MIHIIKSFFKFKIWIVERYHRLRKRTILSSIWMEQDYGTHQSKQAFLLMNTANISIQRHCVYQKD